MDQFSRLRTRLVAFAHVFWRSKWRSPTIVVVLILLANFLYISGLFNANPINLRSGLINGITPGIIGGQYTIDPSDGFYAQALGRRAAVDAARGNMPWWNHYEGVGAPLIGGLQSAALFPLQFLLILPNGLFYFHLILEIITGLATFYFLKRLRIRDEIAIMGAVAFGINGTFAWITHTIFNPIAFLPVLLLGMEMALDATRQKRKRGWLLVTVAIAATVYAGFPETGFICCMLAGVWALARMTSLPKALRLVFLKKLTLGASLGAAIAAPLLVAFVTYFPHANVGLHAGNTANLLVPKIGLSGLVMPYIYGPIFANWGYDKTMTLYGWWAVVGGFISLLLLVLAIIGLWANVFRRADRLALGGWIFFTISATFGFLWMNQVAGHIPLISSAAFARYFPPTYEFAIIILAAFGLQHLWDARTESTRKLVGRTIAFVLVLVAGLSVFALHEYHRLDGATHITYWFVGSIVWALVSVILLGVLLWYRTHVTKLLVIALILFDAAVMYAIPMLSAPREATIDLKPVLFLKKNLGNQRIYSLGPIQPNYGSYYGIAEVNINDIPQPQTFSDFVTDKLDPNVNPITFTGTNVLDGKGPTPLESFLKNIRNFEYAGVKYLITFPSALTSEQVVSANLKMVFQSEISQIYELPSPKPYYEVLSGTCKLSNMTLDSLNANCTTNATLLRREQYLQGWDATVSEKTTTIKQHNKLFQEITVPKGNHAIGYHFEPPYIKLSYVLVIISLGVITVAYTRRQPQVVVIDSAEKTAISKKKTTKRVATKTTKTKPKKPTTKSKSKKRQ